MNINKKSIWGKGFSLSLMALPFIAAFSNPAEAQRVLQNGSFEDNAPVLDGTGNYVADSCGDPRVVSTGGWGAYVAADDIPGWETAATHTDAAQACPFNGTVLEFSKKGGGVPQDGAHYIELNSSAPSGVTQPLCVKNGETITYSFWHKATGTTGGVPEIIDMIVGGVTITSHTATGTWEEVAGTTTYTGPSGALSFQFLASSPPSGVEGNLIDNIRLELVPYIEYSGAAFSGPESDTTPVNGPAVNISGTVGPGGLTIPITVQGTSTATLGVDYTFVNSITVPAGSYSNTPFPIDFTVMRDSTVEADETIVFGIGSLGGAAEVADPECSPIPVAESTYTITDSAPTIDAVDYNTPSINGYTGGTTLTALTNDTLDAAPATTPTVTVTPGVTPTPVAGGMSMNSDGTIAILPGTTAGSYNYPYQICETAFPNHCDSATAIVAVTAASLVASDDTPTSVNGLPGGSTQSVLTNDMLNGALVAQDGSETTLSILNDGGLTGASIADTGEITVPASTPAGSYPVVYQICEELNPTNCDSATSTVTVLAAPIDAVDDASLAINGMDGGTTPTVLANDTLNGAAVTPADITLTPGVAPSPANGTIVMNADGTVTVSAGTTAGSYPFTYQICENLNPANCDTATTTVTVSAAPIDAVDDAPVAVNGMSGGMTATVLTNDLLNGAAVPVDGSLTSLSIQNDGGLTGASIADTGEITVPASTPAGSYPVVYELCEELNPTNCDTATATVTVSAAPIDAVDDAPAAINGTAGGTTLTVLGNDTLNGAAVNPADITLVPGVAPTPAAGTITMNPDGTITVSAGTTAGNYPFTYQICEVLNPSNCDSATSTITVSAAPILALDDTPAGVNGMTGGQTASVLINDTLNSAAAPADGSQTTLSILNDGGLTGASIADTGEITVPATTPAGTYPVVYELCEELNPGNCDTATATVTVSAAPIDAIDDAPASINGMDGGTTPSVLVNDTLNGAAVNPGDITLTLWGLLPAPANGSIVMNADGTVTVSPGTTAGSYPIRYRICEALNPSNCDIAISMVTVDAAPIVAIDDTPTSINGMDGGTTSSVLGNDTLNGVAINPADITLTPGVAPTPSAGSIVMNGDGTLTVASGTTAGSYPYPYQICENLNPSNCDSAVATVTVDASPIAAVDDTPAAINGFTGGSTSSVLLNDTLNGAAAPVDGSLTSLSIQNDGGLTGASIADTGEITVPASTPAGSYLVVYELCEELNPSNCDTATATVTVDPAPIDAVDDAPVAVNGMDGGATTSVLANDTLNGAVINPADISLVSGAAPSPASGSILMNGDGTITVAAGTTAGRYPFSYHICEVLNPANCDSATSVVTVSAAPITAGDDDYSAEPVNAFEGLSLGSVLANDTLNGAAVPVDGSLTNISIQNDGGMTGVTLSDDGMLSVPAGLAAGSYTLTYLLCEELNPGNCDSASVSIEIFEPALLDYIKDDLGLLLKDDLEEAVMLQAAMMEGFASSARDRLAASVTAASCQSEIADLLGKQAIVFEKDSAILLPQSEEILDDLAGILKSCGNEEFEIAGHTDSDGAEVYNQRLSQARVEAVKAALSARDVDTTRLVARGYGETLPIADNSTEEGQAINRRVEFNPLEDAGEAGCTGDASLRRKLDANGDENGAAIDGAFQRETTDCGTGALTLMEGTLSHQSGADDLSRSQFGFSWRREHMSGPRQVTGVFLGGYGSQNDVSSLAEGQITGFGINGGVYGAFKLPVGLMMDTYLGAAAGHHRFDLDFARSIGTIEAEGSYSYLAGFGGAALSGEITRGRSSLSPRIGLDGVLTSGQDVDVETRLGDVVQNDRMWLSEVSGMKGFSEIRIKQRLGKDAGHIALTPRLTCYQGFETTDDACALGAALEFAGSSKVGGLDVLLKLETEKRKDGTDRALTASLRKKIEGGSAYMSTGQASDGKAQLGAGINLSF